PVPLTASPSATATLPFQSVGALSVNPTVVRKAWRGGSPSRWTAATTSMTRTATAATARRRRRGNMTRSFPQGPQSKLEDRGCEGGGAGNSAAGGDPQANVTTRLCTSRNRARYSGRGNPTPPTPP